MAYILAAMMILRNLRTVNGYGQVHIGIEGTQINAVTHVGLVRRGAKAIEFENALVFPGLINSHDHLDFNLFPALGNGIYKNYTDWGNDIHQTYRDEIAAVNAIPLSLRAQWGVYKNLLCGVTTVVNHGEKITIADELINIYQNCQSLHSVHFQKKWRLKLNDLRKIKKSVAIHTGEGTDEAARQEIDELIKWNLLKRKLIGVHGVAMTAQQAQAFKALVWCPQSNFFLLNKTADIDILKSHTKILFGTDSTLTAHWNIWDHLQMARQGGQLIDAELYKTLNSNAAKAWNINSGFIESGRDADLVVAQTNNANNSYDAFFSLKPEDILLVIQHGAIRMYDESMHAQLLPLNLKDFSRVMVNGRSKFVGGDLPGLIKNIKDHYPEAKFPVQVD